MAEQPQQEPPTYKLKFAIVRLAERNTELEGLLAQANAECARLRAAMKALLEVTDVQPCDLAEVGERFEARLASSQQQGAAWTRELLQNQHEISELAEQQHLPDMPSPEASTKKAHTPQIVAWRTWPSFRADMCQREAAKRKAFENVDINVPIDIDDLAGDQGRGDSTQSIKRTMRDYGLNPGRDWPPSRWPEEDPRLRRDNGHGHLLAAMVGGLFALPMLDAVIRDRLFDGIVHLSRLLGCAVGV